jgi:hypothetical protein
VTDAPEDAICLRVLVLSRALSVSVFTLHNINWLVFVFFFVVLLLAVRMGHIL